MNYLFFIISLIKNKMFLSASILHLKSFRIPKEENVLSSNSFLITSAPECNMTIFPVKSIFFLDKYCFSLL